jgi:hypothetical protein
MTLPLGTPFDAELKEPSSLRTTAGPLPLEFMVKSPGVVGSTVTVTGDDGAPASLTIT